MKRLTTRSDADAALHDPLALVYKHSTTCPISAAARQEIHRFADASPDTPVYWVDVTANQDVSRYIAERTGIPHHSPQAILVQGGEPRWHASHFDVTAAEIENRVAALQG